MAFNINVYCFYCIALKSQGVGGLDQNPPYGSATTLERLLNLLTRNEKPEGVLYSSWRWHSVMRNANPLCFSVSGKNFTGNEKFQGNIYPKPEESPELWITWWYCKTLPGFPFLLWKFSHLTNEYTWYTQFRVRLISGPLGLQVGRVQAKLGQGSVIKRRQVRFFHP